MTITLSEDPSLNSQVKHIDIKYHFLQEHTHTKEITLSYVNTKDNIADAFTKVLPAPAFQQLQGFMGLKYTLIQA